VKNIPVKYNDVEFRSTIEAKWAAMFDLLRWPWEYEPIKLNHYIPDFIIQFGESHQILVEVKWFWGSYQDSEVENAKKKIKNCGWFDGTLVTPPDDIFDPMAPSPESPNRSKSALILGNVCSGRSEWVGYIMDTWLDEWDEIQMVTCKHCRCIYPCSLPYDWCCKNCGAHNKCYDGTILEPYWEHINTCFAKNLPKKRFKNYE
jgi:hypothetical protein